ncbi:MAG TPA: YsnF/AvaK domain-containing protein [Methylomirabilota bacterium]|jgi:uncharacterized protein (TIGR02271 family)
MTKTIVGLFDTKAEAERVANVLAQQGFDRREIQIGGREMAERYGAIAGARDTGADGESWWSWLFGWSESETPDEHGRDYYHRALTEGGSLLVVTTTAERAERARRIMELRGAEVHEEQAGTQAATDAPMSKATEVAGEKVVPIVEEQLKVGKRQTGGGRVRVYNRVTEQPVEEEVRLRQERVNVERRPVDRPLREGERAAFREDMIELTETSEEPVIMKEARVVEEVAIGKDVQERTETIKDTVRRTDVRVERSEGAQRERGLETYEAYEPEWRRHHAASGSGFSYEQVAPAYRYGGELGGQERAGGEWSTLEPEARRRWEERHPETWERFKEAIRYGWQTRRGESRAA